MHYSGRYSHACSLTHCSKEVYSHTVVVYTLNLSLSYQVVHDLLYSTSHSFLLQSGLGTLVPFKCPNGRSVGSARDCDFDNCAALDDQLQLSWTVRNDMQMIDFRLCGCLSGDPKSVGVSLTQN